jgi:CheY-like chemotaxis protein/HPt (histidine-containing phosphotransfer) domain-containing protein
VLVAEDNAINLELCIQYLEELGIGEVRSAANGEEVLERLDSQPGRFDVILMDVRMPRLDGLAATREILRRWPEADARPRIVAITAHAFEEERQNCLRVGMDRCLSKPLRLKDLESVLRQLTDRGETSDAVAESEPEEPSPSGSIDWRQFDKVVDGPDSPCVAILEKFAAGVPEMLGKIREATAAGDAGEAGSLAHQLKGSGSSFGFAGFAATMKEIEVTARSDGDLSRFGTPQWEAEAVAAFVADREAVRAQRGI